jgi:murein DD-endopeptidase MepM/ murein hydrolase activator NlpD
MNAAEGSGVYASEAGVVVFSGMHTGGFGNLVIVDHGGGWTTYYAHLSEVFVWCGKAVEKSQHIGTIGMSGDADTVQLHFELRRDDEPLDPRPGACRQQYSVSGEPDTFVNPLGLIPYVYETEFRPDHVGIDLAAGRGTPVMASAAGVVVFAGYNWLGYGDTVVIDHGGGWTSYYTHLDDLFVGCGEAVEQEQVIGEMGNSGNATGVHLHFELHDGITPVDPTLHFEIRDRDSY